MEQSDELDRRAKRTKSAFREAFIGLLKEKELSKITVKEIAERADRDRKTFYLHYGSIEQLTDELLGLEVERIVGVVGRTQLGGEAEIDVQDLFESLSIELIMGLNDKSSVLRHVDTDWLVSKMRPILTTKIVELDSLRLSRMLGPYLEPIASYFCGGLLSLYHQWSSSDSDLSLETLASLGGAALAGGIAGVRTAAEHRGIAS